MPERDDEQFDAMIREFFADTLDAHQGRCERGFRRHLEQAARSTWKHRTWLLGAFVTGMAASVAMLWASPLFRLPSSPDQPILAQSAGEAGGAGGRSVTPVVERLVQSQTTDEGVVVLDGNTPFRILRRQELEKTRWYDPAGDQLQAEQVIPKDDLVLMKLSTY